MEAANPNYRTIIEQGFAEAAFVADVGVVLLDCGPGWCETKLMVLPRHLQHTGVVHAGVQTTIADHTAGAAAMSVTREGDTIVTAEFKLTFLRAGQGEALWCRAQVVKAGRAMTFVESEVHAISASKKILICKFTATMAVIAKK